MLSSITRIIKSGWLSFWRNKWLSSAAIAMMSLTIFTITNLLLINVLISSLIDNLEDKIDISVYFHLDTPEEEIINMRADLVKLSEVKSAEYVSADQALKNFKERHRDNDVLMQSLHELGSNPLEASLNIKAQTASQFEAIAQFFNKDKYQEIIDKVNYMENKAVIARLSSITNNIRKIGFIGLLTLAVLAVIVAFNTIRLTIYSSRKEIKVMKLVGGSNWFVRGPFVVEGAIYGIAAAVISMILLYPLLWWLSPRITAYLPGTDIFYYFQQNFILFLLLQIAAGVILGTISSAIAVRRYLET